MMIIVIIIVEEKQIEAETQEKGREGIILMMITIMIIVEGKEIETEIQEKDRREGIILMMISIIIIVEGKQIETLKGESTIMNDNQKQHQAEPKQMEQKERIINRIMAEAAAQDGTCHNTMDEVFIEM